MIFSAICSLSLLFKTAYQTGSWPVNFLRKWPSGRMSEIGQKKCYMVKMTNFSIFALSILVHKMQQKTHLDLEYLIYFSRKTTFNFVNLYTNTLKHEFIFAVFSNSTLFFQICIKLTTYHEFEQFFLLVKKKKLLFQMVS